MFRSTYNKGIQMRFSNGIFISVQFGAHNNCDNRAIPGTLWPEMAREVNECNNAEILIENSKGVTITHHFKDHALHTAGYLTSDQVAEIISKIISLDKVQADLLEPYQMLTD